MTVHIVVPQPESDWVCARLARYLAVGNEWSISEKPRADAEWNVFIPYLMWERSCWDKTKTAAWFTHKETGTKGQIWDRTAPRVDLRGSQAAMYVTELAEHGPTRQIRQPVDLDKFRLRPKGDGFVVGTAGTVYDSGRKGEALLCRLMEEKRYTLRCAGRGWPGARWYHWGEMQGFYQGLHCYVCTSTIEGGPCGVFEALACGCQVVIPWGVGQMDELPERPGVWHYRAGDYDDMLRALAYAECCHVSGEQLRALVESHTIAQWCQDWADFLDDARPEPETESASGTGQAGVYIVAFGKPSRDCAQRCIRSVHRHMPGVPVALVSDRPLGTEDVFIEHADGPGVEGADIGGRSVKTRIYDLAPGEWEYVLYLDADTELTAPVPFLFDLLRDGWDMAICENPGKYHIATNMIRPDNQPEMETTEAEIGTLELLQLQGGVFSFRRNERTATLFHAWHDEWQRWGKRDQGALLRAMYKHPVKLYLLGIEWNTSNRYPAPNGTAGIMHYQMEARRHSGLVWGRNDSDEAWRAVEHWGRDHG